MGCPKNKRHFFFKPQKTIKIFSKTFVDSEVIMCYKNCFSLRQNKTEFSWRLKQLLIFKTSNFELLFLQKFLKRTLIR